MAVRVGRPVVLAKEEIRAMAVRVGRPVGGVRTSKEEEEQ